MAWEKYSSDPKIALITNSFGDKLLNDDKKVHAKNCISNCKSFWPTVKRMTKFRRPSILAKTLYMIIWEISPTKSVTQKLENKVL